MTPILDTIGSAFQVRFNSLFKEGRAMAFPCDAAGHVELDALSPRARDNYLFARAMVGMEYAAPRVIAPVAGDGADPTQSRQGWRHLVSPPTFSPAGGFAGW
jgi:hypothetical protein